MCYISSMTDQTFTIAIQDASHNDRLDKVLSQALPQLTRTRIKSLILEGSVQKEGAACTRPSAKVLGGESYIIHIPELVDALPEPQDMDLDILFEDDDLLVLNKPAGLVVHPAPGHPDKTLVNGLLAHCGNSLSGISGVKRPGIVHRLDKETSGLMVVAKHDKSHAHLSAQFSDRSLSRRYKAIVWGLVHPVKGKIEGNIGRHPRHRQKMAVVPSGGKEAVTHFKMLTAFETFASLIECQLETGRTHQIRVHMESLGFGVAGDTLYGNAPRLNKQRDSLELARERGWAADRHALHAYAIQFIHPRTEEEMSFEIDLPEDMKILQQALKEVVFAT